MHLSRLVQVHHAEHRDAKLVGDLRERRQGLPHGGVDVSVMVAQERDEGVDRHETDRATVLGANSQLVCEEVRVAEREGPIVAAARAYGLHNMHGVGVATGGEDPRLDRVVDAVLGREDEHIAADERGAAVRPGTPGGHRCAEVARQRGLAQAGVADQQHALPEWQIPRPQPLQLAGGDDRERVRDEPIV